jgi:hypothetical protein
VGRVCREAYRAEADPDLHAAVASVLGHVHGEMHALYKPDDNAQDRAVQIYRGKHPAAAHASFAVVIYPTDRPAGKN